MSDAREHYAALYDPLLTEIRDRSSVADAFLDKDIYRIYLATLWANAVTAPERSQLGEADLEPFHDFLVERAGEILGGDDCVRDCFRHLISDDGEQAMLRCRVPPRHRAFLVHFGHLMLHAEELPGQY
jgi:hypothetical protein